MKKLLILSAVMILFLAACEEEFVPEVASLPPDIVVEGYIEAGAEAFPPYVLLTQSFTVFEEIDPLELEDLFIHDALVEVSNKGNTFRLVELCWDELSEEQQELLEEVIGEQLGRSEDTIPSNFCVYFDPALRLMGMEGERYDLRVELRTGEVLTATTTIPFIVRPDSVWFVKAPGNGPDSLKEMRIFLDDPAGQVNFYRYATKTNDEPLLSPLGSVTDDQLFDGDAFEFPLARAEPRGANVDINSTGLFVEGDSVRLKWMNLDEDHFNFWNTLEFNVFNQGPFANYTRIQSNIEGGLGIWGGYGVSYYDVVAE